MEYISPGLRMKPKQLLKQVVVLLVSVAVIVSSTQQDFVDSEHVSGITLQNGRPFHHDAEHMFNADRRTNGRQARNYRNDHGYDFSESTQLRIPEFLDTETNIVGTEGESVTLPCSVRYIGTRKSAWRRVSEDKSDSSFLALDGFVFDQKVRGRFHASTQMLGNQVTQVDLKITSLRQSDAGTYECQIPDKKAHRRHIHLTVKPRPPAVKLTGEQYVEQGESIKLMCNATGGPSIPHGIDWFKDGNRMDATYMRSVNAEIVEFRHVEHLALVSDLVIRHADVTDSGSYICRSSDKVLASLKVTVLGEPETDKKKRQSPISLDDEQIKNSLKAQEPSPKDSSIVNIPSATVTLLSALLCLLLCRRF